MEFEHLEGIPLNSIKFVDFASVLGSMGIEGLDKEENIKSFGYLIFVDLYLQIRVEGFYGKFSKLTISQFGVPEHIFVLFC